MTIMMSMLGARLGDLLVQVASTKTITAFALSPNTATANVTVSSDGNMKQQINGAAATNYEVWLDSGVNSQVWVQRVIISGTLSTDAGSGRLQLSASRTFGKTKSSGFGTDTCVIDLNFYDASSGGNLLDTQRVTLNATREP